MQNIPRSPETTGEHLMLIYSALQGINANVSELHRQVAEAGECAALQSDKLVGLVSDVAAIKARIEPMGSLNGRMRSMETWQAGAIVKIWLVGVLIGAATAAAVQFGVRWLLTGRLV
ncbi:MAG: hypothetical protein ABIH03_11700 [Pseudomonadota bacterium]